MKVILFINLFFAGVVCSAQAPLNTPSNLTSKHVETSLNRIVKKSIALKSPKGVQRSRFILETLNPIDMITSYRGTTPYLAYSNPIFPDSNVIVSLPTGSAPAWLYGITQTIHIDGDYNAGFGGIFDPLTQPFTPNNPIRIDSVTIQGYYDRIDTSIIDTALIYVMARRNGQYNRLNYSHDPDSAKYVTNYFNKTFNKSSPDSVVAVYKVVLDAAFKADSLSNGGHLFKIAPNLTIPNTDGVIGIAFGFKPGKVYSQLTDTIYKNINSINVVYATPLGQNQPFPLGDVGDYTIGGFNDMNSKYGTWSYFMPPYAFVGHHPYQLYDINVKIYQFVSWGSIQEQISNAKLYQNYPNPFTNSTTIKYQLETSSEVTFEVMDVTGKKIISEDQGNKNSGVHSIEINTDELNSGIYFYSIIVNSSRITKKMTVSK